MASARELLKEAMSLPPIEKARLIEQLLHSLDQPSAELDELWAEEAESRIEAHEGGRIEAVTLEEVLEKYK